MSSSLPPGEGPGPYEGRGLDELLSGTGNSFPDGLRRVAQTLDALRDAPMPAELGGEAAARAAFRKLMVPGESAGAAPWPAGGIDYSRTMILPRGAAGGGAHPAPGRHRRRSPQRGRLPVKVLVPAAVAVVVVAGAALASTLTGSGTHPTAATTAGATKTAPASASSGSNAPYGGGSAEASAKPTATSAEPSQSGPSSTELCHEYFEFYAHPGQQSYSTVKGVLDQLSARSGGEGGVFSYCVHLLEPWAAPQRQGSSTGLSRYPIPGSLPGEQEQEASQEPLPPGARGNGNGNSGNGNGNGGIGNGGNGGQ